MQTIKAEMAPAAHPPLQMVMDFLALAASSVAAGLLTALAAGALVLMLYSG